MNCLCCGKEIRANASPEELEQEWHKKCIMSFFGTRKLPYLDLSEEMLEVMANESVNQGLTITGVQKKLSLHLELDGDSRLTIVNYPTGYILKPQTEEYVSLPEYEMTSMQLADLVGIQTVPHALIKYKDTLAYITKRIDRDLTQDGMKMFAMEDFCQLANRLTEDKYKGSYEVCGKIIMKYSERVGLDISEFLLRVIFSYVIGNSDMHLKNFSLIEISPRSRSYVLSKAYDFLPVNLILLSDKDETALTINGKKRNITKKDFYILAEKCGVPINVVTNYINMIATSKKKMFLCIDESKLKEEQKDQLKNLIQLRLEKLI